MRETVLVTGGAGYIGSHLCVELLDRGAQVVVLDDLSSGSEAALDRVQALGAGWIEVERGDVADPETVERVFDRWHPDAVLHLAARKSVAGSVADPRGTERTNVQGTESLAAGCLAHGVRRVVFASSASVYGDTGDQPATEAHPTNPRSPYARSKLEGEAVLTAAMEAVQGAVAHMRFFNVAGAHPSGRLGDWSETPENLIPLLVRAARLGEPIQIFGTDWPTRDGTCVRDYVHVLDIVDGMLRALAWTRTHQGPLICNLGSGTGSTVREVVAAVERASGQPLATVDAGRRPGDPAHSTADPARAAQLLDWWPVHDLDTQVRHAWAWNPTSV